MAPQARGSAVAETVSELEVAQQRELVRGQRRHFPGAGRPTLGEEPEDHVPAFLGGEAVVESRHRRLDAAVADAVEHLERRPVVLRVEDVRGPRAEGSTTGAGALS